MKYYDEEDNKKKDKRIEDGERMVCCDISEVWQHTRCVGDLVFNTMRSSSHFSFSKL